MKTLTQTRVRWCAVIVIVLCGMYAAATAVSDETEHTDAAETFIREGTALLLGGEDGNIYAVGNSIVVDAGMEGDIYALAGSLNVDAVVTGDVGFVGETATLHKPVEGDVRIIGTNAVIHDTVDGEVLFLGTSLTVTERGTVTDTLVVYTDHTALHGIIHGDIYAGGARLDVYGTVHGSVHAGEVTAVTVHAGAHILGDVTTPEGDGVLTVYPSAVIDGERISVPAEESVEHSLYDALTFLILLAVSGAVLYALTRKRRFGGMGTSFPHDAVTALLGAAAVCMTPIAAVILLFIPGLAVFGILLLVAWLTVLCLGIVSAPAVIGTLIRRSSAADPRLTLTHIGIGVGVLFVASVLSWLLMVLLFTISFLLTAGMFVRLCCSFFRGS